MVNKRGGLMGDEPAPQRRDSASPGHSKALVPIPTPSVRLVQAKRSIPKPRRTNLSAATSTRGEIDFKKQLERLQRAYVAAVIAAAGCSILQPDHDDGTDLMLKHRSASHTKGSDAFLEVQLKCTSSVSSGGNAKGVFPVLLENERFKLYAANDQSVQKIVVGMIAPHDVGDWVAASDDLMELRHCCYWVSIRGKSVTGKAKSTVHLPIAQRFDDQALGKIMTTIGSGGVL